jgi:hypothetical protein
MDTTGRDHLAARPAARRRIAGALVAGIAACFLVFEATAPPGPGLDPDAMAYLGAAQWLVARGGYRIPSSSWTAADSTEPLAHFPPGLPTAIAAPIALGIPALQSARLIICLSALVGAALVYALVDAAAGATAAAVAVCVVFASPTTLEPYLSALSEPPFIACVLAVVASMTAFEVRRAKRASGAGGALLGMGIAGAVALMVRYAGAGIVGAAIVWPLVDRVLPWTRRVARAALVAAPSVIIGGIWVRRTARAAGASGIRQFTYYGGTASGLAAAAGTLRDALVPVERGGAWRGVLAGIAAVCLVRVVWLAVRRLWRAGASDDPREPVARALLASIAVTAEMYLGFVLLARTVADPGIPFDRRIMAPLVVLLDMAIVIAVAYVAGHRPAMKERPRRVRVGIGIGAIAGMAWLAASVVGSRALVEDAVTDGLDLAEARWRESPTLDWVRRDGGSYAIFTNWPPAVYFHAHRATHDLPERADALTLRRFRDRLVRAGGIVVAFDEPNPEMASPDSIAARVPLRQIARLPDGTIWAP